MKYFVEGSLQPPLVKELFCIAFVYYRGGIFAPAELYGLPILVIEGARAVEYRHDKTGVLGRLSDDAIAANSVSTTIFQYLKIVAMGEASASSVLIGKTVGETSGDERLTSYTRTLQALYLLIGAVLGAFIFRLVYTVALRLDMPAFMLKLVSAVIVVLAISIPYLKAQLPVLRRRMQRKAG